MGRGGKEGKGRCEEKEVRGEGGRRRGKNVRGEDKQRGEDREAGQEEIHNYSDLAD